MNDTPEEPEVGPISMGLLRATAVIVVVVLGFFLVDAIIG